MKLTDYTGQQHSIESKKNAGKYKKGECCKLNGKPRKRLTNENAAPSSVNTVRLA